jgi:predicted nucleotidyltransferase
VGEIAARTQRGSEIGVRRSVARLVEQGVVSATEMGRNRVHELNRDHVAAPIAVLLAGLRLELWSRLRRELDGWRPRPTYACVFGSAARGDGDAESDIDLLLVHPPFPGETDPRRSAGGLRAVAGLAAELIATPMTERQAARWSQQADQLHGLVRGWSGNPLQVVDVSGDEWADHRRRGTALFEEISRDAVELVSGPSWATAVHAEAT